MSLIVTQRPSITVPDNSFWNGVANPILYKFQREDYQSNSLTNSSGNLRIVLTGNLTSEIIVGASVYYRSDNAVYDGYYTVLTISYSAPDTTITFTGGYVSAGTTGFINLTTRLNYKAEINVVTSSVIGTIRVSPDKRGVVIADVSRVLWSALNPDINFDLALANNSYIDSGSFAVFNITYRPIYIGTIGSLVDDVANRHYVLYGGRQIPSLYGGNFFEYCRRVSSGTVLFLTKFSRIRMWRGWPAPISVIVNEYNTTSVSLNIPGGGTSSSVIYGGNVVAYDLNDVATTQTANTLVCTLRLDSGPTNLSEAKTIVLSDPCKNPILLMGRNSLGGILYWLFDVSQEYTFAYDDGTKRKRLVLFAENITLNEFESLEDFNTLGEVYKNNIVEFSSSVIKTSSRIGSQVYAVDKLGNKTGVIVIPTENQTNTRRERHSFTLEIEYPEMFTT
jgi:hypothetical protein